MLEIERTLTFWDFLPLKSEIKEGYRPGAMIESHGNRYRLKKLNWWGLISSEFSNFTCYGHKVWALKFYLTPEQLKFARQIPKTFDTYEFTQVFTEEDMYALVTLHNLVDERINLIDKLQDGQDISETERESMSILADVHLYRRSSHFWAYGADTENQLKTEFNDLVLKLQDYRSKHEFMRTCVADNIRKDGFKSYDLLWILDNDIIRILWELSGSFNLNYSKVSSSLDKMVSWNYGKRKRMYSYTRGEYVEVYTQTAKHRQMAKSRINEWAK